MADNKKIYSIQINGIEQSIKQVDALSDALQFLDKKIKDLESRSVSVSSTSSGGGTRTAELQTEDKLLKQIQSTEEKIREARREDYQSLLAQKDVLKDIVSEAEQRAAQERLTANNYGNSMKGMKQELSDLKKVFNTVDVGSDKFKEMTARAGELTQKLKDIEQSYGQFGRNVGNYKSAFDDIKKVTVQVGNTAREFGSVRDASRQLTQELKAMAIAGKQDTEEYKELAQAVHNFEMASRRAESAVNDLKASSEGMDNILDMFESFTALGSIGQGFSAFFGIDDTEIQKSIQKLVALQNVMQGIEKIRQQMNTQEGIGAIFAKGSSSIDGFVAKLTGAQVTMNGLTASSKAATLAVRGLSLALKAIGVGLVLGAITMAIDAISKLGSEMDTASKKAEALDENLKSLNDTYKKRIDSISASYLNHSLSDEEFLKENYKAQNDYLREQIDILRERAVAMREQNSSWFHFMDNFTTGSGFTGQRMTGTTTIEAYNWWSSLNPALTETVHNIKEVEDEFLKCQKAFRKGKDYFDEWGTGLKGWFNSLFTTVGDTERMMRELGNIRLSDFVGSFAEVQEQFRKGSISAEEYANKINELKKEMDANEVLRSVIANLDKYIPDEKVREAVQNIINEIYRLDDAFNMTSAAQIHHWAQVRIDAMKEGSAKIAAQLKADEEYEIAQYGKTQEQINLIHAKYERKRLEQTQKYNEQARNKAKQHAKQLEDAEKELNSLRIQNMKEGLNKQIAQLEEEKRQKIAKARQNGIKVGEITFEIEKLYNKKILEAKEEWARKIQQVYTDMWARIYSINHQNAQMNFETEERQLETHYKKLQEIATKNLDKNTASYSPNLQGLSPQTAARLGQVEAFFSKKEIDDAKGYIDMLQKIKILENSIKEARSNANFSKDGWLQKHTEILENELQKEKDALKDYLDFYDMTEEDMEQVDVVKALREQNYSKTLLREYKLRINNRREYYQEVEKLTLEELEKQKDIELRKLEEARNEELRTNYNSREKELQDLKDHLKKTEITQQQYDEAYKRLEKEYAEQDLAVQDKYNSQKEQKEQEHQDKIKRIKAQSYNSQLQEYRDFTSRLSQVNTSEPIRDGVWGFPNIKKTKERNQQLLNAYQQLSSDIVNEKHKLQASLDKNEITFDDFQQAQRELNNLQNNVSTAMQNIEDDTKKLPEQLASAINYWVQAIGQSVNTILSSLSEITDNHYQEIIEKQEEYIKKYEEQLNRQKEITQEYANEVKSIEDELATARGDRREQLIDLLNAEMAAQRASLAQEKKIEKEREKAEEKKKKLEYEQAVARKNMQLAQAAINMAMAISMAAVNSWPIPAIPMMALAAAAGAAQIAAVASTNIPSYGEGGVIQGRSHEQGGVKVLGGQAEVEGGEFITNKVTTSKNVDLLEYINRKKKKISLDDLVEFYGGKSQVKKNVQTARTKFADGGIIPTMRNDINLSDRMLTAFEDYSNRPVQVAVVDIIDRTQQVNDVKVMAGITD